MMDSGLMQLIAGMAVLFLVIEGHWYGLSRRAVAWIWLRFKPHGNQCAYLSWKNMLKTLHNERYAHYLPLHHCQSSLNGGLCKWEDEMAPHHNGDRCWDSSILKFFAVTPQLHDKPTINDPLQTIQTRYLCVDRKVLLAYILCTLSPEYKPRQIIYQNQAVRNFDEANLKIEVLTTKEELSAHRPLIAHLTHAPHARASSSVNNHRLSILEVKGMLKGYPPFYRELISYRGTLLRKNIMIPTQSAIERGGWVVAAGFSDHTPLPVYLDRPEGGNQVFWNSIRRVKETIETNFPRVFEDLPFEMDYVKTAIRVLDYFLREQTISGRPSIHILFQGNLQPLSKEECEKVIDMFNGKHCRNMSGEDFGELKRFVMLQATDGGPSCYVLLNILRAAVKGSEDCTDYIRHNGRNLNLMLPKSIQETDVVYLKGC